jgi:hypothetical protein
VCAAWCEPPCACVTRHISPALFSSPVTASYFLLCRLCLQTMSSADDAGANMYYNCTPLSALLPAHTGGTRSGDHRAQPEGPASPQDPRVVVFRHIQTCRLLLLLSSLQGLCPLVLC